MTSFVVPGRPTPKQRPRVQLYSRRAVVYTPRETREYEESVAWCARKAFREPFKGPVVARLRFYVAPGPRRGDCDNLAKSVLDGCRGIAFEDDGQVVRLEASVHPCDRDGERAEVEVEPLSEEEHDDGDR